ncbi:SDR family NAD(P)-dependent oxidoreductase [Streptomyces profundus]|nr:SDR family NAD(P)-dependent oxidoreductase [Streptomyces sp. MA3_2.13]
MLLSLGEAFVNGVDVDWGLSGRRVELPTYPFQRQHYWLEAQPALDTEFWEAVESGELGLDEEALRAVTDWRQARRNKSTADSWRYQITWKPIAAPASAVTGTWLVVTVPGAENPLPEAALTLELGDASPDRAALAERLREVTEGQALTGVLSLAGADERPLPGHRAVTYGLAHTVALVQALGDAGIAAPLWVATRGAVSVGGERLDSPTQAQLWGLGRVVAQEHPQAWGGLVDLPAVTDERAIARFATVLSGGLGGEDQVAVRADGVHARRFTRAGGGTPRGWQPSGTVLVTGGTGAVGGRIGRWLAENGAARVVLTSRRGPAAPGAEELCDGIRALGAEATVAACDVADRDALAALLAELPDLTAVVHAAVVLDDGVFDELDATRFDRVLAPKTEAARHLHELTRDRELSAFVLFSSAAGTLGNGGQANYAAANAYLDALAEQRRAEGLTATSIAWGPWGGGGSADGAVGERLLRQGVPAMDPDLAISALHRALDLDDTTVAVADIRWETFHPGFVAARRSPLVSDLVEVRALPERTSLEQRLAGLSDVERDRVLLDVVRGQAAAVLGYASADAVEPGRPFRDLGFDSLTAVDIRNRLNVTTGLRLSATVVFDYPTPTALADHLRERITDSGVPAVGTAPEVAAVAAPEDDDPIAIVSLGCRFPGGVESPEELWELLVTGGDAIAGFPDDRGWDLDALYSSDPDQEGTSYTREGGFLREATQFDSEFFGISPREALAIDPQQRLLLEVCWEAVERAGIDPKSLRGSRSGVFVGNTGETYTSLLEQDSQGTEGYLLTGNTASVLSGRIAYTLGLEGPALTVDTACSSSLMALHLAVQSLRQGECTLALAGGVTILSGPAGFIEFSRQRGLAADGRCKAFDTDADGTGFAEGVGIVVVERLSDARRNGHPVLALLRGSAVNSDGASNGLTAPNGPAQQRVIRQALANAGVAASDVDVVEAHGTGTRLGDPIEAQALLATYGQDRDADRPLWLGTVKSNIGHTLAASGIAGVMKMVLSLRHELLPRTLHVSEPTAHVDWSAGEVRLLTEARPWRDEGRPRLAGVSSFGISGTNTHVILEQPPADEPAAPRARRTLPALPLVLSGRDEAALREQARRVRTVLAAGQPDVAPLDVAFSLATTRAAFEHGAVVIGTGERGLAGLVAGLDAVATGAESPSVVRGTTRGAGALAFLFTGQGSQRLAMGRALHEAFDVYAEAFDAVCERFELPVRDVVFGDDAETLNRTEYAQPALFAVEVALFRLLEAWGVRPDYLAGHSIGEIAAAHVAGVLTLDDACVLVAARGRLMGALPEGGAMVAVQAAESEVVPLLTEGVAVAAVNGPDSVVLSGDAAAVVELAGRWKHKRLSTSHAFHSPLMDPMLDAFRAAVGALTFHRATIPIAGQPAQTDAAYWVRHVRDAVRFHDALEWLRAQGAGTFLEIGPDGVLSAMADGVPTLRGNRPEVESLLTAVAGLQVRGMAPEWPAFFAETGARRVDLPTYPFQRQRYWPAPPADELGAAAGDIVEARFWDAVEREDLAALATALDTSDEQLTGVLPALATWRRKRRAHSAVDSWRYRVDWKPATGVASPALTGTWLLVGAAHPDVEEALARCGATVVHIEEPGLITRALTPIAGVLAVVASPAETGQGDVPPPVLSTVALLRALAALDIDAPLWLATRGAVAVSPAERDLDAAQAAVWGLGQVIGLEQPMRWGGLIDLPATLDGRAATRLGGVLAGTAGDDQVAIRPSGVFRRRLVRAPLGEATPARTWTPTGTALVTGGTGALGAHTARWLATAGAEHLLLISRRGAEAPGAAELAAELTAIGARVTIAACDAADREALAALLAEHPVDSVFHTAGVLDDGVLDALTPDRFQAVFRAKVTSARHLDELTRGRELSAFVLFSSLAGVMGNPGQGNYAAANACLDALAERRRAAGLPAVSVAWGAWAGGMADGAAAAERVRRGGVPRMPAELALAALGQAIDHEDTVVAIADMDWARTLPEFTAARPNPLVAHLAPAAPAQDVKAVPAQGGGERDLVTLVRTQVAAVLGHGGPDAIDPERAFNDLGFDSLTAVELRNRLAAATGRTLPATLVFDHPTPAALAGHLRGTGTAGTPAAPRAVAAIAADEPIAIVGMACRFPGGVTSPEELWRLLLDEGDATSGFPENRGWDGLESVVTREGAFLHDADLFDPAFFGISPREALAMDPQQRLLLETAWEAFERSGIAPSTLRGSRTGVFIGTNGQDYVTRLKDAADDVHGFLGTGNAAAVVSGRLSYTFGLEGPAVTVDTACSSSLVALHWAAQSLRQGECATALVGGVTVMSSPAAFVEFSKQGGLAADGRCKAFAAEADGTAWGEGAGLLVVRRLSDARRDGQRILAVVRGSAVNSDGASNGLTAPNGPSQQRVIQQALEAAGLTAGEVDAVEAHGTGTALGDPIEAQALLATYGQDRDADRPLWLGSVKSNIGHTQAAAGVAGVIKMALALRNGVLPPTLHIDEPTPHVDWSAGSVALLTEAREWVADAPRRAGVSSFGMSGTNAHVILEEAPPEPTPAPRPAAGRTLPPLLPLVLSAAGPEALAAQAAALRDAVTGDLGDLVHSLATTRSALSHRAVVLGGDRDALRDGLDALVDGRPGPVTGLAGTGRLAFLFSGQGSQRPGMGRELYDAFPVFADAFDAVCARLQPQARDAVFGDDAALLNRTEFTQAGLFAVEVALFRLLEAWGVRPEFLAGHSIGEIAAAHVAGVLALDDACALVAARGRLMGALPEGGAMVAVQAAEAEVLPLLTDGVDIAAVNGPDSVVLSGDEAAVVELAGRWKHKRLSVSHAFHSHLMEPMLAEFRSVAETLTYHPAQIPVAGQPSVVDAEYWVRHVREAVRFHDAVEWLRAQGVGTFLEIGPDGVLSAMAEGTPALRKNRPEVQTLLTAVATLHVRGTAVDWAALVPGSRPVTLPTYPFQRTRFWPESTAPADHDGALWAAIDTGELALDDDARTAVTAWRDQRRREATHEPWRYRVEWKPLTGTPPALTGSWLVLNTPGSTDSWASRAAEALPDAQVVSVDHPDQLPAALADMPAEDLTGVLSLLALDATADPRAATLATAASVRALGAAGIEAPLWIATSGAVSTGRADRVTAAAQAAVWGLGRVVGLEHPDRWGGLVDLPERPDDRTFARLATALGAGDEDQLAIRSSGVFLRRLAHQPLGPVVRSWAPRGAVLVTGGTGGLGGEVARWLVGAGVGRVVLTSRRGVAAPGAEALRAELGERVSIVACDMTDRDAVAALLDGLPDLTAVVHAAGAVETRPLAETSLAAMDETMAAKVLGAAHLDELLGERELDAFVLFSSIAGVWGSGGQAAYAAANAYLDALAEQRRARGLTATAVAWGPWAQVGMAAEGEADEQLRRRGLPTLAPDIAIRALRRALDEDRTQLTVADVHWDRFAPSFAAARPRPLIADLPEVRQLGDPAVESGAPELAHTLAPLAPAERLRHLTELVRAEAAAVLGHADTVDVAPNRPFRDLGFDSLTAVELRQRLQAATGLALPTTLVFDHPTAEALAELLGTELLGAGDPLADTPTALGHAETADDPVVIVGMSCRYPGGVRSPEELWRLTAAGTDAITGFPTDRGWDVTALYDADPDSAGSTYTAEGGFLPDAADFDAGFFGISPREALAMDPQQRLLLEASWEALESAGIDPTEVRGTQAGVFVGVSPSGYGADLTEAPEGTEGYFLTGSATAVASGRVSYTLGLEGPAVTVDTACSSSLVALHYAAQSLRQGECSMALVGGVAVMASPRVFVEFSRQRGLAEDGRCKSFSDDADGTGWGEGVGMLLVERLSDARRNGHPVLAVVRGSAVNQDGASNGLTAPNGPAQQRVIRQALANARLTPDEIDVVEAHGTGTRLGDPIEAQALLATYGQHRDADRPLWLGSVKSNIGHTQAAAGVAGVIKMVMAMRHGTLPRSLHAEQPTRHVDWSTGGVQLLSQARPWDSEGPRRAAVSAFGVSGTNAHTVLEEAPPADAPADPKPTPTLPVAPVFVSGRGPAALRAQAARLLAHLDHVEGPEHPGRSERPSLPELAHATATTRAAHDHRAAVLAADHAQLLRGLAAIAAGDTPPRVVRGVAGTDGRLAFLFTGQGSQRLGMGRELYETFPVYAEAFDACCALLDTGLQRPLRDIVFGDPSDTGGPAEDHDLHQTRHAQAGLFAVEVALFRLVESLGIRPDAVAGHSIGEIAAAHVAGVLSLEDACALVTARGRLMQRLPAGGAMVAVQAGEAEVLPLLGDSDGDSAGVCVAAVNAPDAVVLSGDEDAVLALASRWKHKRLTVSHAFHSHLMDPMLDAFRRIADGLTYHRATIPVGGQPERVDADYWVRHVRDTVRFHHTVEELRTAGVTTFVELGPDAALSAIGDFLPLQRRDRPQAETLLTALATLHTRGISPDWRALLTGRPVDLPTYAFQRERFWLAPATPPAAETADSRFWETVERGDLAELADTLDITPDTPLTAVLPALSSWHRKLGAHSTADSWRYRVEWKPLTDTATAALTGTWLVVGAGALADAASAAIADHGADPVAVQPAGTDRDLLAGLIAKELETHPAVAGVLSLLAVDERPHPAGSVGFADTVTLAQALLDAGVDAPLWLVTSGAVSVGGADRQASPAQALTWGLGRVIGLDQPTRWGGLVDLPPAPDPRAWTRLIATLSGAEDEVAVRPAGAFARRLAHANLDAAPRRSWAPRGAVLVTGGTGGLGGEVARWLVASGVGRVVLTSRRGVAAPGAEALRAELGERVSIVACDMTDRDAVAALLDGLPDLTAVVHAAGVGVAAPLAETSLTAIGETMAAKVLGAAHLDELLGERELDAFVLFSSIAGVWGSGGQAAYAAANAYLDALAEQRRARGLTATAVAWGPWAQVGMAVDDTGALRRRGLRAMAPELAVTALRRALDRDDTTVTVADVDWEAFTAVYTAARPRPFLDDVAPPAATPAPADEDAADPLRARLATLPEAERLPELLRLVRTESAAALGHESADRIEPDRGFLESGFDSLTAVELRNRLGTISGLRLPTTLIFDYPTPTALARHLAEGLAPAESDVTDDVERLARAMAKATDDERADTVTRLRNLLNEWTEPAATDRSIEDATADEIFDLIHEEFGKTQ